MGSEQQIGGVADGGADFAAEALAPVQRLQIGHAPVIDGVLARRVKLHGGETLGNARGGRLGAGGGVIVEYRRILVRPRIEVGVGSQPLIHQPAKKRVNRTVERLADDVPAGHFQPADHALDRRVGAVAEAGPVGLPPEMLDPVRRLALEIALEHVLGHPADNLRGKARGIDFADAGDAA